MGVIENNSFLCKKSLEVLENTGIDDLKQTTLLKDIVWTKINGYMGFGKEGNAEFRDAFKNILTSINIPGSIFSYVISGNKDGLSFYFGTNSELLDNIKNSYIAFIPGVDITGNYSYEDLNLPTENTSLITGIPTDRFSETFNFSQIDDLCRGTLSKNFAYIVIAQKLDGIKSILANDVVIKEMQLCSENITKTINSTGVVGNVTKQSTDYTYNEYLETLTNFKEIIKNGLNTGLWNVSAFILSDEYTTSKQICGIVKGIFSGDVDVMMEPIRCIDINNKQDLLITPKLICDTIDDYKNYPLGVLTTETGYALDFYKYKYQTILSSNELGIMCRLPLHEYPGIYVDDYVLFDTSMRNEVDAENRIDLGTIITSGRNLANTIDSNKYVYDIKDFTRHALIIGATGGGKTNTIKSILKNLWTNNNIPFLVIESAKKEYWDLYNIKFDDKNKNFKDLRVYTLGLENKEESVKYRINPFEVTNGASIQSHIDSLISTFQAAFELYPPMPYVLETSIYEIYEDRGWNITENKNELGLNEYPTLTNLYYKIEAVTDRLGYDKEVQSNVKAALKARINSLRIGGKGAMLDTPASIPISSLLSNPTVLELDDLGDDETKAFVMGILMVQLYEYRKSQINGIVNDFNHLLVIEEAHRLLSSSGMISAASGNNSKQKSIEFFCNMLAEIRTYGQGILIADQVPTKLASDAIKNTNLKIVHRTVSKDDRTEIGYAMNMKDEQIDYLSSLSRGVAAVYAEGDNKPKLVKFPLIKNDNDSLSRKDIIKNIQKQVNEDKNIFTDKYMYTSSCAFCSKRCILKDKIEKDFNSIDFKPYFEVYKTKNTLTSYYRMLKSIDKQNNLNYSNDDLLCLSGLLLNELGFAPEFQHEITSKLLKYIYKR